MDKPTKPTKKDFGLSWYQCQLAGVVGRSPFSGSALVDAPILSRHVILSSSLFEPDGTMNHRLSAKRLVTNSSPLGGRRFLGPRPEDFINHPRAIVAHEESSPRLYHKSYRPAEHFPIVHESGHKILWRQRI